MLCSVYLNQSITLQNVFFYSGFFVCRHVRSRNECLRVNLRMDLKKVPIFIVIATHLLDMFIDCPSYLLGG